MTPLAHSSPDVRPRILVIGPFGQIGFELIRHLQGLGVVYSPGRPVLDLGDPDSIRAVIQNFRPTLIVNAAAYTDVARAEEEIALARQINGIAPGIIAEAARQCGATLIHCSTDYVFDGAKSGSYQEDDAVAPLNQYGISKLAGERAVAQAGGAYLIFRTSWIYGTRGRNFLSFVQREAALGHELKIVADQIGAPTWSATVAALTAHVARQGLGFGAESQNFWRERSGVYHLTSDGATSWHGFAQAIIDLLPESERPALTAISSAEFRTPVRRPVNSVLDTTKFKQTFGLFTPSWRDALAWCVGR